MAESEGEVGSGTMAPLLSSNEFWTRRVTKRKIDWCKWLRRIYDCGWPERGWGWGGGGLCLISEWHKFFLWNKRQTCPGRNGVSSFRLNRDLDQENLRMCENDLRLSIATQQHSHTLLCQFSQKQRVNVIFVPPLEEHKKVKWDHLAPLISFWYLWIAKWQINHMTTANGSFMKWT